MKKLKYIIGSLIVLVFLNSCAPVYKCGDPVPYKTPALWSKNLKSVVSERDNLCKDLAAKKKEISILKDTISNLSGRHNDLTGKYKSLYGRNTDLEGKYKDLINENLSKTDQYNKALSAKSEELNDKEKLLSEREKTLADLQVVIARQDSITKRLNKVLHDALLGFNSDELSVEIKNGKVYVSMSDKLLFKSGSSAVEDKGKEALKLLSDVLDKNTDIDILVEGHTDNVPIKTAVYKDNWDLSVARATTIVRILTNDYKIAPTRMTASGKGEYFPKSDNDTPEGRAKNRRTEIILSPKLDEIMKLLQM
jgi:chemotaxis protein MotB